MGANDLPEKLNASLPLSEWLLPLLLLQSGSTKSTAGWEDLKL
jgi:hypothetical protein